MRKELQGIQSVLRRLRLLGAVEWFRYLNMLRKNLRRNRAFGEAQPGFAVPPTGLAYDAYNNLSWDWYQDSGRETTEDLWARARRHMPDQTRVSLFEWGCGPGRTIRHWPTLLPPESQVSGSDYNPQTIEWCTANLPEIRFVHNDLRPPLPFSDSEFDLVLGLSVLTHLSEPVCLQWMDELRRITRENGVFIFTTKSDKDAELLLPRERALYDSGKIVVRDKVTEGKKMYGAWHAPSYVKSTLLAGFELLEQIPPGRLRYVHSQEAWVAKRSRNSPR